MSEQRMHIDEAKTRLKKMELQLAAIDKSNNSGHLNSQMSQYLSFQISEYKTAINAFKHKDN